MTDRNDVIGAIETADSPVVDDVDNGEGLIDVTKVKITKEMTRNVREAIQNIAYNQCQTIDYQR